MRPSINCRLLPDLSAQCGARYCQKAWCSSRCIGTLTNVHHVLPKMIAEDQRFILIYVVLIEISKELTHGTPPAKQEKVRTPLEKDLFELTIKLDNSVYSWKNQELRKRNHFWVHEKTLWTGRNVLSQKISIDDSTMTILIPYLSFKDISFFL